MAKGSRVGGAQIVLAEPLCKPIGLAHHTARPPVHTALRALASRGGEALVVIAALVHLRQVDLDHLHTTDRLVRLEMLLQVRPLQDSRLRALHAHLVDVPLIRPPHEGDEGAEEAQGRREPAAGAAAKLLRDLAADRRANEEAGRCDDTDEAETAGPLLLWRRVRKVGAEEGDWGTRGWGRGWLVRGGGRSRGREMGCAAVRGGMGCGCHVLWNPRPETIRASIMEPTVVDMARRALPAADITSERRMTGRRPILSER